MSDEIEATVAPRDYKAEIIDIVRGEMPEGDMLEALLDYHENDIAAALAELDVGERASSTMLLTLKRSRAYSNTRTTSVNI